MYVRYMRRNAIIRLITCIFCPLKPLADKTIQPTSEHRFIYSNRNMSCWSILDMIKNTIILTIYAHPRALSLFPLWTDNNQSHIRLCPSWTDDNQCHIHLCASWTENNKCHIPLCPSWTDN